MNSIFLACLVLAGAAAIADSKHKGKCGGKDVPMCALVYDRRAKPTPPPKPDCSTCVAEAMAMRLTDKSIWIPACNKDNSFKKEQYDADKNESFCVNPYGEEDKGTRVKGNIVRCKKDKAPAASICRAARAKAIRTKAKHVPTCDKAGEYHQFQYFSTSAKSPFGWCALKSGKPVPHTFFKKSKKGRPNCGGHRVTKADCKNREGVVKHPFDCRRYLQCGADTVYTCICPYGQAFNTSLKVCDWLENVKGCPPKGKPKILRSNKRRRSGERKLKRFKKVDVGRR